MSDELINNLLAGTGIIQENQPPRKVEGNQKRNIGKSESLRESGERKHRLVGKVSSLRVSP